MEDTYAFLDKKENWATWEDEEKDFVTHLLDLQTYLGQIKAKLDGDKPDPTMEKEKETDRLKAIVDELNHAKDELREKLTVRQEAYLSTFVEIYKMPGCIDELLDLLKSYPGIDSYAASMIEEEWYEQYDHHMRELRNNSSKPQEDIISEGKKLLTRKSVEIQKARAEVDKLVPQIFKVHKLLCLTRDALSLALKSPDHEHVSSSSEDRKYNCVSSTSSSSEEESPSPRDNKRARK